MTMPTLAQRAADFGLKLSSAQLGDFEIYRTELLDWNSRVNLTAITDRDKVEVRHFVDSLACFAALRELLEAKPETCAIDVGSGAGFPGLPLKIALPALRLTLLDSVGKKTRFLTHLVETLELEGTRVITARSETLAHSPEHRERYDVALARALAPLPVLLELCLPFLRIGGRLVAPRRGDLVVQQAQSARALEELGGRARPPIAVDLGCNHAGYGLVVVDKVRATPGRYPRRAGLPAKSPLV